MQLAPYTRPRRVGTRVDLLVLRPRDIQEADSPFIEPEDGVIDHGVRTWGQVRYLVAVKGQLGIIPGTAIFISTMVVPAGGTESVCTGLLGGLTTSPSL